MKIIENLRNLAKRSCQKQSGRKHKTEVEGYESLRLLCEEIHRMRYDKVGEFYGYSAAELRQQSAKDKAKGRTQLAALLEEAADITERQQRLFFRIWALCEPHMKR